MATKSKSRLQYVDDPVMDRSTSLRAMKGFKGAKDVDSMPKGKKNPVRTESNPFRSWFTPRKST